jgi:secreted PhoX family phosphatase
VLQGLELVVHRLEPVVHRIELVVHGLESQVDPLFEASRSRLVATSAQPTGCISSMLAADPATGEIRRFLIGPVNCEVTGITATPDGRTLFAGIQHPGESPSDTSDPDHPTQFSSWPDGPGRAGRPRSSVVMITKDDGGIIGT